MGECARVHPHSQSRSGNPKSRSLLRRQFPLTPHQVAASVKALPRSAKTENKENKRAEPRFARGEKLVEVGKASATARPRPEAEARGRRRRPERATYLGASGRRSTAGRPAAARPRSRPGPRAPPARAAARRSSCCSPGGSRRPRPAGLRRRGPRGAGRRRHSPRRRRCRRRRASPRAGPERRRGRRCWERPAAPSPCSAAERPGCCRC